LLECDVADIFSRSLFFKGSEKVVIVVITRGGQSWCSWDNYSCSRMLVIAPVPGDCLHFMSGLSLEALCWLGVVWIPCHKDVIHQSFFFGTQSDCRREWPRDWYKMEAGMPSVSPAFS
jgi:hypothetical protein